MLVRVLFGTVWCAQGGSRGCWRCLFGVAVRVLVRVPFWVDGWVRVRELFEALKMV